LKEVRLITRKALLFMNEENLCQGPQVQINISSRVVIKAILDPGSEVNPLSERVYEEIRLGANMPELPLEGVVLEMAFGKSSKGIKREVVMSLQQRAMCLKEFPRYPPSSLRPLHGISYSKSVALASVSLCAACVSC
jgi:hypothetical protein